MENTWIANEGVGIQVWWVATDLFNKQQWTAKKGCLSTKGLDKQLTAFNQINLCYQTLLEPTAFDIFFVTNSATENEYETLVCNVKIPRK
jgi:hypothetical protein